MTPQSLPFAVSVHPEATEASKSGARVAAPSRGRQTQRYLALLVSGWYVTDHEAAEYLSLPLSSICSIRDGVRELVEPCGHEIVIGYGRDRKRTRWKLR